MILAKASLPVLAGLAATTLHAAALGPRPAPPIFATEEKGLTFRTPSGSTYCPLPDDWTGSNHGTVVFLTPPDKCGGAGFPSISRWFSPANTARIEIEYEFAVGDDGDEARPCHAVGQVQLLSLQRPLCRQDSDGMIVLSAWAPYKSDLALASDVYISLVTTRGRLSNDTKTFFALAASIRACSAVWPSSSPKAKPVVTGEGARCPAEGKFF